MLKDQFKKNIIQDSLKLLETIVLIALTGSQNKFDKVTKRICIRLILLH